MRLHAGFAQLLLSVTVRLLSPHSRFRISDLHILMRLIQRSTRSLALTDEGAAFYEAAMRALGALEVLMPDHPPETMPIQAVLPSGRYIAARSRAFVDFVADALARDPLCAVS